MFPKLHVRAIILLIFLSALILPQPAASQAQDPDGPPVVSFAWSATWGDAPQPGFARPTGIDVGPDGNVYVSDAVRNDVQVFTPSGERVERFGSAGSNLGQFREPSDVTARNDKVYVADYDNARVQVLSGGGAALMQIDGRQPLPVGSSVRQPIQVGADGAGRIFLFNGGDDKLYRYSSAGAFERRYDAPCRQYPSPHSLAVISSGVAFCPAMPWGGVYVMPLAGDAKVVGSAPNAPGPYGVLAHVAAAPDDTVWAYRADQISGLYSQKAGFLHLGADGALLAQFDAANDVFDFAASADRLFALTTSNRVRVYSLQGQVLGEWGSDAFAGQNTYQRPDRIAAAPDGTFYVLERERKRMRHVAADGRVLAVLAPTSGAGNLSAPIDLAVDAENRLYVLDQEYYPRVVRYTDDRFDTVIDAVSDSNPYMSKIHSISVTGDSVVLVGPQPGGPGILRLNLRGRRIGQARAQAGEYGYFRDAALGTTGRLFTLEGSYSPAVRVVDLFGSQVNTWGTNNPTGPAPNQPGVFVRPADITVDLRGRVFVVDTEAPTAVPQLSHSSRVQVFDENGQFLAQFGGYGSEPGQFINPQGIAALADGRIVVADTNNNRLQVFTPSGDLPPLQPLPGLQGYSGSGPILAASWQDLGPRGVGGVGQILIPSQPSPSHPILAIYNNQALALSTDGVAWTRQPSRYSPVGPLIYAGARTIVDAGAWTDAAYRSDDLGRTWIRLGDLPPSGPRFPAASPSYDQDHTLFMAAYSGGVWRSTDSGITWRLMSGEDQRFYDLAALPGPGGSRVLLAIAGDAPYGILHSTDDGVTWQVADKNIPSRLYVSPAFEQDQTVFATGAYLDGRGVLRSIDGGQTWTVVGLETGNVWSYASLSPAYGTDKTVLLWNIGGRKSFISRDGGSSWAQFTGDDALRPYWMAFAPSYPSDGAVWRQRFDVAGGIEVTRDGGATWQPYGTSPGLKVTALAENSAMTGPTLASTPYGIVSLPQGGGNASLLYQFQHGWGGLVDLALSPTFGADSTAIGEGVITRDGGTTWTDVPFATELRSALGPSLARHVVYFSPNYTANGRVFEAFDNNTGDGSFDLWRSTDRGVTWQSSKIPLEAVAALAYDATGSNTARLYAGGEGGVAVSTDDGATWQNVGGPLALLRVTGLVSRIEGNIPALYAATNSAGLWRNRDLGNSWEQMNAGLADGYLCGAAGNQELLATVTCAGQVYLWSEAAQAWQRAGRPLEGRVDDMMVQGTSDLGKLTVATYTGAFQFSLPLGRQQPVYLPAIVR